jgi:hypothetical protein
MFFFLAAIKFIEIKHQTYTTLFKMLLWHQVGNNMEKVEQIVVPETNYLKRK